MKTDKRIIFFTTKDPFEASQYKDLAGDTRVELIAGLFRKNEKLYAHARRISKKEHLKFKHKVFLFVYSLFFARLHEYAGKTDIMVFTNSSVQGISPLYYKLFFALHKKIKPVLVFIDVTSKPTGVNAKRIADASAKTLCFSFDKGDAEKYGYQHTMCIYSKYDVAAAETESDIYFIGYVMDKLPMLHQIGKKFSGNAVESSINILGVNLNLREEIEGIHYLSQYKLYDDVVVETNASNCILEVVQQGQTGATLRYYEAICYNKKLLTTNVHVKELPFYNPNYMKVFQNVDEIDYDWIKSKTPIDYHYDGRFSPVNLITEILEALKLD